MITTDFSGTYDYEKEEAENEAASILADKADGYYRSEPEYQAAVGKILAHWGKVFSGEPESLADFTRHFNAALAA